MAATGYPIAGNTSSRLCAAVVILALCACVAGLYGRAGGFAFVNFDDPAYVTENDAVKAGLCWKNIRWSFGFNKYDGHWHPLTWLSHMLDVELYGLSAAGHHLTNIVLHAANTALLFLFLRSATGLLGQAAFAALLFALHPMQVESVAWVAERKNVLSTLFWLLTLLSYLSYSRRPRFARMLPVCVLFALGLLAKPMLVTLPFVLLLLDWWPLGRTGALQAAGRSTAGAWRALAIEKAPLFCLAAASCIITYVSMASYGSVAPAEIYPLGQRAANAVVCYALYLAKLVWPSGLTVIYLHPGMRPPGQVALAVAVLALLTAGALRCRTSRPYLLAGWLWYAGTLVPVSGIIQTGMFAMADRYVYVPGIGIFIAVAGIADALKMPRALKTTGVAAVLSALALTAGAQLSCWRSSAALFSRALQIDEHNYFAHNNLALALLEEGRTQQALQHLHRSLELKPSFAEGRFNLARQLAQAGDSTSAMQHYGLLLAMYPEHFRAANNLGRLYASRGQPADAQRCYEQALLHNPQYAPAHNNLAALLAESGDRAGALKHYRAALACKPHYAKAHNNIGLLLCDSGMYAEALEHYQTALRISPEYAEAHYNTALLLAALGDTFDAVAAYEAAIARNPAFTDAHNNLALVLARSRQYRRAAAQLESALATSPDDSVVKQNLDAVRKILQGRHTP